MNFAITKNVNFAVLYVFLCVAVALIIENTKAEKTIAADV